MYVGRYRIVGKLGLPSSCEETKLLLVWHLPFTNLTIIYRCLLPLPLLTSTAVCTTFLWHLASAGWAGFCDHPRQDCNCIVHCTLYLPFSFSLRPFTCRLQQPHRPTTSPASRNLVPGRASAALGITFLLFCFPLIKSYCDTPRVEDDFFFP